jgi:hypothetical protein
MFDLVTNSQKMNKNENHAYITLTDWTDKGSWCRDWQWEKGEGLTTGRKIGAGRRDRGTKGRRKELEDLGKFWPNFEHVYINVDYCHFVQKILGKDMIEILSCMQH